MTTELMSEALSEMDSLLQLLEAKIPASMSNPQNEKLTRRLERDMAEYFRNLEMAFPYDEIETLYYKLVKQE
jgi:hypothetical protein